MTDVFEPIFTATQLEVAAMQTLSTWMPTYLQEIELQLNRTRGEIPPPAEYSTRNEFTSFPEDKMPLCVVVSPGLSDPPTKEGDGTYSGWWALGVGFATVARDADASNFLAKVYGAAARAILLQNSSLGGISQGTEWIDESYDELVTEDDRVVRACYLIFRFNVWNVVTKNAGPPPPADPAAQPGSNWPTANLVQIDEINVLP